jgi:hypothetical protein
MFGHFQKFKCECCGASCGRKRSNNIHYSKYHHLVFVSDSECSVCKDGSLHTHNNPADTKTCVFCGDTMPNPTCYLLDHKCPGKTAVAESYRARLSWARREYKKLLRTKPQFSFAAGAKQIPMPMLWFGQKEMVLYNENAPPVDQRKLLVPFKENDEHEDDIAANDENEDGFIEEDLMVVKEDYFNVINLKLKITALMFSGPVNKAKKRFRSCENMAFFRKSFTKILKIPRNCRYSIKLRDMHNTIFTEKVVGAHIYERCLGGAGADTDTNLNMQTDNINAGLGYCFERFGRYFIDDGFDVEVVGIFLVKEQIPTEYLANNTKDFDGTMEYDGEEHNLIYGGIRFYLATKTMRNVVCTVCAGKIMELKKCRVLIVKQSLK